MNKDYEIFMEAIAKEFSRRYQIINRIGKLGFPKVVLWDDLSNDDKQTYISVVRSMIEDGEIVPGSNYLPPQKVWSWECPFKSCKETVIGAVEDAGECPKHRVPLVLAQHKVIDCPDLEKCSMHGRNIEEAHLVENDDCPCNGVCHECDDSLCDDCVRLSCSKNDR